MISDLISPAYQNIQTQMHAASVYGHSGGKWWTYVRDIAREFDCGTWLDYGCGTGRLAENVRASGSTLRVAEYDPGVPGKDEPPFPADLVSCIDVLEHIEPDRLGVVLSHLEALTIRVLFTVISTRPAGKVLPDGRNAHLIIEPTYWWRGQLSQRMAVEREWHLRADEYCALWRHI